VPEIAEKEAITSSVGALPSSAGTLDQRTVAGRRSSLFAAAGNDQDIVDWTLPRRRTPTTKCLTSQNALPVKLFDAFCLPVANPY